MVAIAILVGSALLTPPDARTRDNTVPGVATLFLTADLYMGFGFAVAGFWALAAARRTDARVARGLRISAIGLACIVIADCLFVPAILLRLTNALDAMPDASGTAETLLGWIGSVFFLLPGIVVFLAGVTYPALAQRVAALRLWREHRQADREITPLWTLLMQPFPEHRLERLTGRSWREALSVRAMASPIPELAIVAAQLALRATACRARTCRARHGRRRCASGVSWRSPRCRSRRG